MSHQYAVLKYLFNHFTTINTTVQVQCYNSRDPFTLAFAKVTS